MTRSLEELRKRLSRWGEAIEALALPPGLGRSIELSAVKEPLRNLSRRLDEGASGPLRIAFFGPTGAGKSKVFNSVLGESISPSGYRRPFTRRAVYFVHEDHSELGSGLGGDVRLHGRAEWRDCVLIDTPDFDGIEDPNHEIAEHVYLEADVFVFLTDVHKYADAATWAVLRRLQREGKRSIFVINKTRDPGPIEDFGERLREAFGDSGFTGDLLSLGYHLQEDAALLPASEPGLLSLGQRLEELARDQGALLTESVRIDIERFLRGWDALREPLVAHREAVTRLHGVLEQAFAEYARSLERRTEERVDPALKQEVYREMMRRLERIDLLRYPRRLIAMPIRGLRKVIGQVFPALDRDRETTDAESVEEAAELGGFSAVESALLDFSEKVLGALREEATLAHVLDESALGSLRLDRTAVRESYRQRMREYRDWAAEEARSMAERLTGEHKLKFIISQVLFNGALLGVQIQTGGILTVTEILADGFLSPLVAKGVGMVISSEQVRAFERSARSRHRELLAALLESRRADFADFLAAQGADLGPVDAIAEEIEALRRDRDTVVGDFRRLVRAGARDGLRFSGGETS